MKKVGDRVIFTPTLTGVITRVVNDNTYEVRLESGQSVTAGADTLREERAA